MKQGRPQNLFLRLRQRETTAAKPGAEVNRIRRFCEVVTPSSVIRNVQLADCHVCRFTPSGRYLVCFGALQHEVLLYSYTGLQYSTRGDSGAHPPQLPENAAALSSHFGLCWRRSLVSAPHVLCKDFCLALHREAFLAVAAQTPPTSGRGSPPGGGPAALPLVATTTIFLVRASDGEVTDTLELVDDFVHLSHNAGVAACGDHVAVLGLRSQTIQLHQVLADGRFAPLAQLGQHLAPDDALVIAQAAAAEHRWRESAPKAARQADQRRRELEVAAGSSATPAGASPLNVRRAGSHALSGSLSTGPGAAAARGAQLQGIAMERPNSTVLGQLLHAPNSLATPLDSETDAGVGGGGGGGRSGGGKGGGLITGLRQRILAYLCLALRDPELYRLLDVPCDGAGVGSAVPAMQRTHSAALADASPVHRAQSGMVAHAVANLVAGGAMGGGGVAGGGSGGGGGSDAGGPPASPAAARPGRQQPLDVAAGQQQRLPQRPRDRFILNFDSLASLVVWKAQFLDERHLLLALGPPDASALRHAELQQQAAFLAVYSLQENIVVSVLPNSSAQLLGMYLRHAALLNGPAVTCTWERFVTPGGNPSHARAAVDRQMAHQFWTLQQVTRRVLAAIPPSSQVLCASPFLDACLFQYDDKLVSPVTRPRALSEAPLKFTVRGRRETVRLKISGAQFEAPPPSGRPTKQLVTWHFHPVLPFVLGVLQTANSPPQALIYHRL